jgi:hypothetical protein
MEYSKIDQTNEPELSRVAALITLARVEKFSDLNADSLEVGDELFKKKTRELWKELMVSGRVKVDKKTGETYVAAETDLDGRCSLGMLSLAGIDVSKTKYVAPGQWEDGYIHFDTGSKDGLSVEVLISEAGLIEPLKTAFMDHHSKDSKNDTSSTKIAYETMASLGMITKNESLEKLVNFVTQVDNRSFPKEKNYFKNSYKTVWGLERFMTFDQIYKYFSSGKSPLAELSKDEIATLGLAQVSEKCRDWINVSLRSLEEMKKGGLIVSCPKYGDIAIDIARNGKKNVPGGYVAAKSQGCGGYVIWSPEEQSFFISTGIPLQEIFSQGKPIRETMWIKPRGDGESLNIKLSEVLNILAGKNFKPRGELEKFLREEKKGVVTLKASGK